MAPKQGLASRSKSQRKLDRKSLGPLEILLVTPSSQKQYDSALNLLFKWMEQEKIPVPSETHTFDQVISQYLNFLWEESEGRALGSNTLAAIQYKILS